MNRSARRAQFAVVALVTLASVVAGGRWLAWGQGQTQGTMAVTMSGDSYLNISHIGSTVHVSGAVRIQGGMSNDQYAYVTHAGALTVTCQTSGGTYESCGGSGGSGDAVNVFHQSTIRHVSSLTHVGGGIMVRDPLCPTCNAGVTHAGALRTTLTNTAGTAVTVTTTSLDVNCTGGCASPTIAQTWTYVVPSAAVGANKVYLDLFNATGSGKVIKILGIFPLVDTDTAVVGALGIETVATRTSTVGTGGTTCVTSSATINVAGGSVYPNDTNNTALPAQITCRHLPTGGGTVAAWLRSVWVMGEETATSLAYQAQGQINMAEALGGQPITIRENQGLKMLQGAVAATGNIAFRIVFTVE